MQRSNEAAKQQRKTPVEKLTDSEQEHLQNTLKTCNCIIVAKQFGVDFRTILKAACGEEIHRASAFCIRARLQERINASE